MTYTKISPLGKRECIGTFDCFFDTKKFTSMQETIDAHDFVVVDFVKDEDEIIHFEFYNTKTPDVKKYYRLQIQHFPFGIDMFDDQAACEISSTLF